MLPWYEQFKNLFFWIYSKPKLLYAYTENTLNGKINTKSVYISVNNNNNMNLKKNLILSIYTIWDRVSLKPSHATVPLTKFFSRILFKYDSRQIVEEWQLECVDDRMGWRARRTSYTGSRPMWSTSSGLLHRMDSQGEDRPGEAPL